MLVYIRQQLGKYQHICDQPISAIEISRPEIGLQRLLHQCGEVYFFIMYWVCLGILCLLWVFLVEILQKMNGMMVCNKGHQGNLNQASCGSRSASRRLYRVPRIHIHHVMIYIDLYCPYLTALSVFPLTSCDSVHQCEWDRHSNQSPRVYILTIRLFPGDEMWESCSL